MEFQRLCAALQSEAPDSVTKKADLDLADVVAALDGPIVVQKGPVDKVAGYLLESDVDEPQSTISPVRRATILECAAPGAPRRPGGLGDFLAGSLGTMLAWAAATTKPAAATAARSETAATLTLMHACVASCALVRDACKRAYGENKRAMIAPDVLDHLPNAVEHICPAPKV